MIAALACLLFPFVGNCPAYVRDVPSISQLVDNGSTYSGKEIRVTGRVRRLHQFYTRTGRADEVFLVCDGGCVRVFLQKHSPIRNAQLVSVLGPYYRAFHTGRSVYYNEIEATEVLSRQ